MGPARIGAPELVPPIGANDTVQVLANVNSLACVGSEELMR